jgi:hypothetical protein
MSSDSGSSTTQPVATKAPSTAERAAYARRMHYLQITRRTAIALSVATIIFAVTYLSIPVFRHIRASGYLFTAGFMVDWQLDADNWTTGGVTVVSRAHGSWISRPIDPDIEMLPNLLNVQELSLSECLVTDEGLAPLSKLKELRSLNLSRLDQFRYASDATGLSDACLDPIQNLTRLETLTLSGNRITDRGLAKIANLTNLQYLDLDATDVTDAGLVHLYGLKNLISVNLGGTLVTPEGVARLKQALPVAEVTTEIPENDLSQAIKQWRQRPQ